jgi:hypothetical protein
MGMVREIVVRERVFHRDADDSRAIFVGAYLASTLVFDMADKMKSAGVTLKDKIRSI